MFARLDRLAGVAMLGLLGLSVAGRFAYVHATVVIPAETLLVYWGSDRIAGAFPSPTRLWKNDPRLRNTEQVPYWRFSFTIDRSPGWPPYVVDFSIMGSPEEGLKYRPKSRAGWRRQELEAWGHRMLGEFERESGDRWRQFGVTWTEDQKEEFREALRDWFGESVWANQGISIRYVGPDSFLHYPDARAP